MEKLIGSLQVTNYYLLFSRVIIYAAKLADQQRIISKHLNIFFLCVMRLFWMHHHLLSIR